MKISICDICLKQIESNAAHVIIDTYVEYRGKKVHARVDCNVRNAGISIDKSDICLDCVNAVVKLAQQPPVEKAE